MKTILSFRPKIENALKVAFVRNPLLVHFAAIFTQNYPKIFLYHRFCATGSTVWGGISQDEFEWQISRITDNYDVITFGDYLERKRTRRSTKYCVIITVDDGYRDFYLYAYPILKKAGVSATLFVTSDFISQQIWLWPDKLKFIIAHLEPGRHLFVFGENRFVVDTHDDARRLASWSDLSSVCKSLLLSEREQFINFFSVAMGVEVPELPGNDYAACSWDELCEMRASGIEIGSHTLTHPILSKIPYAEMVKEVCDSKHKIEQMLDSPVVAFCYPNGRMEDINDDVIKMVAEAGYWGAAHVISPRGWNSFLVPRMGADDNRLEFIWRLCGMESLVSRTKQLL